MKRREFRERWLRLTRSARNVELPLPEPPVHRVRPWMLAARHATRADVAGRLWEGLAWRGAAAAALALMASLWFAWSGGVGREDQRLLPPRLEQAVADGFWLL